MKENINKTLNIPTKGNYWRVLVEIMDYAKPFSTLDNVEKDVFSELLSYNYKYKDLPFEEKNELLFGNRVRGEICEKLEMTISNLNNKLYTIGKKGLIESNGRYKFIPKVISDNLSKLDTLTFKFIE